MLLFYRGSFLFIVKVISHFFFGLFYLFLILVVSVCYNGSTELYIIPTHMFYVTVHAQLCASSHVTCLRLPQLLLF